ncbi:UNVERIFIED_CONTAM: Secreted RxLR effector protein [Sesamum calycinum]|uniref:Secreted RxLR effector protein n=1 Tax=Sesamum calycinum TaxID=2727403 RepID=A0AAW2SV56_9LAMI
MNGLEKSINELINMLVQYKAMTKKSTPSVLVGEASTSKVKGKRAEHWKRNKGKAKAKAKAIIAAKYAKRASVAPLGIGKGKRKIGTQQQSRANDYAPTAVRKGIGRGIVLNSLPSKVLQISRKVSKDEVVLRLGDGKAVIAEAVGTVNLAISDHDKEVGGLKELEIENLDNLLAYVCGPLNTQARGGFSYFITFTDDHSRYGYVYLMRYKSEAFVRFKEFRLEDHLKKNGIVSQRTPPGTPQLNGMVERRNRTLLDIVRSMMSFTELPLSFRGYVLEKVTSAPYVKRLVEDKLDSRSSLSRFIGYPKEIEGCYFYDPFEQNVFVSRNAVFLKKGFPTDTRRDELLLEESSEAPQSNTRTSSAPIISVDNFPILRRSTRVPQPPERYGFLAVIGQLDNDIKTYGEAMSGIYLGKWFEAMKFEMDSMSSNQVLTLVDRPKGVKPVGCKWVYKRKIDADGEVTAFKARLVAKGSTRQPRVDFEETFSPIAMAKSIRIMLAIAVWNNYEIWQTDVKMAFLNDFVEEEIYMDQLEGFMIIGEEQKNDFDPCVYKKISRSSIAFLVLYVDDNKVCLSTQFSMKDLGEAFYILGIKIFRDISKRMLRMTQNSVDIEGYSNASFQLDDDDAKSQSGFVFKLNGGVVAWKSSKQDTTVHSTTKAEYRAASEEAKEAVG